MRPGLYLKFEKVYEDAKFVIASNTLPSSDAAKQGNDFHKNVWLPITTRVDFACMVNSHNENKDFPYTKIQLANALQFLCENSSLVSSMDELDELKPQDSNIENIITKWHKEA